jgi:NTP pyrophosphatase (non-canonical NTP hydrolase)
MLSKYQQEVDDWMKTLEVGYWTPHEMLARATEEMGELARLINHQYGPKKKKTSESEQELGEEIADVIFAIVCIANAEGINLDEAFARVMDKCYGRDKERFEKK